MAIGLIACGDDNGALPLFPENYRENYVEVRSCRQSADHDLNNIRILADPLALASYTERKDEFPTNAIVLKEEFEFDDQDCSGPVKQWTVMQRLPTGTNDNSLDWTWQTVDASRNAKDIDPARCNNCHTGCGVPPDGFDGTCAVP